MELRERGRYRVFRFGDRDIVGLPAMAPSVRAAGVSALPAVTRRGRAFRFLLRTLVRARVDRLLSRELDVPTATAPGLDWGRLSAELETALGRVDLSLAVVIPRQSDRARLYVHLLSPSGERIAFAKLATRPESDPALEREAQVHRSILRTCARAFRFPRLIDSGSFEGRPYLLLTPLPVRSTPHPPIWTRALERIRDEIAGPPRTLAAIDGATWWPEFVSRSGVVPALAAELAGGRSAPFRCRRAHGDLVNWNVHVDRGDHWLFDWESYASDAPARADELRFELGILTRQLDRDAERTGRLLLRRLGWTDPARRRELAEALAFLHARGTTSATKLASLWGSGAAA